MGKKARGRKTPARDYEEEHEEDHEEEKGEKGEDTEEKLKNALDDCLDLIDQKRFFLSCSFSFCSFSDLENEQLTS